MIHMPYSDLGVSQQLRGEVAHLEPAQTFQDKRESEVWDVRGDLLNWDENQVVWKITPPSLHPLSG